MYDYEKTCQKFLQVNCKITDTKEEYEKEIKGQDFQNVIILQTADMNILSL